MNSFSKQSSRVFSQGAYISKIIIDIVIAIIICRATNVSDSSSQWINSINFPIKKLKDSWILVKVHWKKLQKFTTHIDFLEGKI